MFDNLFNLTEETVEQAIHCTCILHVHKSAGVWAYILLGLQENIEKSLCRFMHNNAKKLQRK